MSKDHRHELVRWFEYQSFRNQPGFPCDILVGWAWMSTDYQSPPWWFFKNNLMHTKLIIWNDWMNPNWLTPRLKKEKSQSSNNHSRIRRSFYNVRPTPLRWAHYIGCSACSTWSFSIVSVPERNSRESWLETLSFRCQGWSNSVFACVIAWTWAAVPVQWPSSIRLFLVTEGAIGSLFLNRRVDSGGSEPQ